MRARDPNADKVIAAARLAFQEAASGYTARGAVNDRMAVWWRLHNAAIAYVSALATDGADGKQFYNGHRSKWLEFMRANSHAIAGALLELNEPGTVASKPRKVRKPRKAA